MLVFWNRKGPETIYQVKKKDFASKLDRKGPKKGIQVEKKDYASFL